MGGRRWLAGLVFVALVAVGLPAVAGAAASPEGRRTPDVVRVDKPEHPDWSQFQAEPSDPNAGALSAAGEPSSVNEPFTALDLARGRAAASGERVEVAELRTASSSTFANPDGSLTDEVSSAPVWAPGPEGGWVPVDPTLERAGEVLQPRASVDEVTISAGSDGNGSGSDLVRVTSSPEVSPLGAAAAGVSLTIGVDGGLPVPEVEGPTARYKSAAGPGSDLVVAMNSVGPQVSIVIPDSAAGQDSYALDLTTSGVTARVGQSGTIELTAADGTVVGTLSAPVMFDSTPSPSGLPARQVPVGRAARRW